MHECLEIRSTAFRPFHINKSAPQEIERISTRNIDYEQFFYCFLQTNIPVILTAVTDRWECYKQWILRNETDVDKLNVAYLKERINNVVVPVADCDKQYHNSHEKQDMLFYDFLNYWEGTDTSGQGSKLYLKDWHLREMLPEYQFYETPQFFASDWLNEYLTDSNKDDYMFVYIGPKDTWTSFHADVFFSYSWSTNISGMKKWLLLPPGQELLLTDSLGNLPFEISEELLDMKNIVYYKVLQMAGEAIFVPSGWYHQVHNVQSSISVNHNWFNGCNIEHIWINLHDAAEKVTKEIDDCKDMENFDEHCQIMLNASYGMNFESFLKILTHISEKRIKALKSSVEVIHFDKYRLGVNHIQFDLNAINAVLTMMLSQKELLSKLQLLSEVENCILRIRDVSL
ncbi:2-oxoglutarate and iron-dependent oxygenase JMJD4 homolog isoform X2 [Wyeomyia smithii]|nr:2-oxoglutarate and iron-dependent oxygenase JMJD4 homolog isoform X2 [Wyeomyia smithii]XP_055541079.1 2-oxoglutarate and iron-dependent oxygenase JMJD4 homolog isoform X2 [Wyeomyia smithii]